jgi:hypothetical protein
MSASEVLRRISVALDRAGIAYMLTGSFASAYHGAPRSTQDIDIVIAAKPEQLRRFVEYLPSGEYDADLDAALEAHRRESLFNVIDLATGWKMDLIIRKSRAFSQEEFGRRQSVNAQVPCSFRSERRGLSHRETGMVKAGAIATADRGCGGNIRAAMGIAEPALPGKMDLRVKLERRMEQCQTRGWNF